MRLGNRWLGGMALVLALAVVMALAVPQTAAQTRGIMVDGTPALFTFMQTNGLAYSEASGTEVVVNISGDEAAFAAFCAGQLDIVNAGRAITDAEAEACAAAGVEWVELLTALDGVVFFSGNSETTCVTLDDLAAAFGGDSATTVIGRGRGYQDFVAAALGLERLSPAVVLVNDDASVFNSVGASALGYTSLAGALTSGRRALEVDGGEGCVAPNVSTVAGNAYSLGRKLYHYVSVGAAERLDVAEFVNRFYSPASLGQLPSFGLVEASSTDYERGLRNWANRTTGRTFSAPEETTVALPEADLTLADGSAALGVVLEGAATAITVDHPGVQYRLDSSDTGRGLERLCSGETDIAGAERAISDEETAACQRSGVFFIEFLAGYGADVVVTNRANDFASCLTAAQFNLLFASASTTVSRWDQLQEGFPPFDLTVYRSDIPQGVAGNENGVGLVSYGDYRANAGSLNVVAINGGAGCVGPTDSTIADGTYPLNRPLFFYVNADSAQRPAVQQVMLNVFNDSGVQAMQAIGLVPASAGTFAINLDLLRTQTAGRFFSR